MANSKIILILIFAVSITVQQDEDFQQLHDANEAVCIEEAGVTQEEVKNVSIQMLDGNTNLKCFKKCLFTKFGLMDETGDVVDEVLEKHGSHFFKNSVNAEITRKCKDVEQTNPGDPCEVAYALVKCMAWTIEIA